MQRSYKMTVGLLLATMSGNAAHAASAPAAHTASPLAAYYISPNGSDSNNGTSLQTPFATLEKARAAYIAVRPTSRNIYLLGGTYQRSATLNLSQPDLGETWRNYPGQTPIINGNGTVGVGFFLSALQSITIYGLTFNNFSQSAILTHNVSSILIKDNTIMNTRSTGWVQSGIMAVGSFVNGTVSNNLVENSGGNGIAIAPDPTRTSSMSGTTISDNAVINSCLTVGDCGAIYVEDPVQVSKGVSITHNLVAGFGNPNNNTHGIYLDNNASSVSVSKNVVYGTGSLSVLVHGGSGNALTNNIFDITGVNAMALYQQIGSGSMSGNQFTCNIVYSSAAPPVTLWVNIGNGNAPAVSRNAYWDARGTLPNVGIVDVAPVKANPQFAAPSSGNYTTGAAPPAPACFTPFSMTGFGPSAGI